MHSYTRKLGLVFLLVTSAVSCASTQTSTAQPQNVTRSQMDERSWKVDRLLNLRKTMAPAVSPLTTHVLDTSKGEPARGVDIALHRMNSDSSWALLKQGTTDDDGRVPDLLKKKEFSAGVYKMLFQTRSYFQKMNSTTFYPYVEVVFEVVDTNQHYHVPLLISPYGFSTYRGS